MMHSLFRAKLVFQGGAEELPDNPLAPKTFGLSEGVVCAHASPCITSLQGTAPEPGRRLTFNVSGASDADGKVISLNVNAYDTHGKWLGSMSAPLAEEDVRKLAAAINAVIELTPDAPQ